MSALQYEAAIAYALEKLEQELPANLFYHSLGHTCDDVVPAVKWLVEKENITGEDKILVVTAAWYHDLGYTVGMDDHETSSKKIASQVLPGFGYSDPQIELIRGMIEATRVPQRPQSKLEEIMADADLDTLGRIDFFDTSHLLYVEMLSLGNIISPLEWIERQYKFLQSHSYFTAASKNHREPVKKENIAALAGMLDRT